MSHVTGDASVPVQIPRAMDALRLNAGADATVSLIWSGTISASALRPINVLHAVSTNILRKTYHRAHRLARKPLASRVASKVAINRVTINTNPNQKDTNPNQKDTNPNQKVKGAAFEFSTAAASKPERMDNKPDVTATLDM